MKNSPLLNLQTEKYPRKYFSAVIFMIAALLFAASSRPAFAQSILSPVTEMQQLKTNLYVVTTSTTLLDATLTQYSSDGNNAVDGRDALKIQNIAAGTRLGMLRDSKNLVIERRQSINVNDTIFYNLMTASKRNYRFEFIAKLDVGDVENGFLEDAYLNTSSPVTLSDTTMVDFIVNADAASSAANRFILVFEAKFFVLPLPFTFNVRANQQNNDIAVEWIAENEANIKTYVIENIVN